MGLRDVELTAGEAQIARLALRLFQVRDAAAAERVRVQGRSLSLPEEPRLRAQFVAQGIWGMNEAVRASGLPTERQAEVRRLLFRLASKVA